MSDSTPPPEPNPRSTGPVSIRRSRPKPTARAHPPVKRSLRDYWVMFWERWYWGLVPAVIIGGVLAYQQWRPRPSSFYATATLQFAAKRPPGGGPESTPSLATYVEQMRSSSFRDRAVTTFTPEEIELIRRPYLAPPKDGAAATDASGPDVKTILADAITIAPRTGSPFVDITTTHRDGSAAVVVTNRYARSFIEFNTDVSETSQNATLLELNEQERIARQRVEETETRVQEYREANTSVSVNDNQNLVARRLAAINDQLIEARRQRVQLETTLQRINDATRQGQDLTSIAAISEFRGIKALIADIDSLQAQRALLERKYLENHPSMKANQLEIDAKTELVRRNIEEAVAELRSTFAEARQNEERLQQEQKAAEKEQLELVHAGGNLRVLEEQATAARELYSQIEKRRSELVIARGLDDVTVSILDRATAAKEIAREIDQTALIQGGAIALALFFIVPLAFGLSDTRLKAAWEVEQFLKENLLGEMPAIEGVPRKERPHIMARDLDHGAAEAFRGLFGQLQLNSTVPYPKLLMLTSTLPGEGKSVVANNLAATFAGHGKKTLLIDCDFRRPNLHVYYGKDNACGVMRWLEQQEELKGPALEDQDLGILPLQENFYLLRAGGESRRATELFELESFGRLLASLRKQFDIVLMDTPPIGVFPDSMLLSRIVDEIAYVCRFNAVNRSKIRKCIERLRTPNAVFAGIILNGIPSGKQSAHYDYYGYGANEAKRYKAYYSQRRT